MCNLKERVLWYINDISIKRYQKKSVCVCVYVVICTGELPRHLMSEQICFSSRKWYEARMTTPNLVYLGFHKEAELRCSALSGTNPEWFVILCLISHV